VLVGAVGLAIFQEDAFGRPSRVNWSCSNVPAGSVVPIVASGASFVDPDPVALAPI
jgi:hypothetical protein